VFGQTCGDCRLLSFLQAGHGRGQRPAFPAPLFDEGDDFPGRTRAQCAARMRTHVRCLSIRPSPGALGDAFSSVSTVGKAKACPPLFCERTHGGRGASAFADAETA